MKCHQNLGTNYSVRFPHAVRVNFLTPNGLGLLDVCQWHFFPVEGQPCRTEDHQQQAFSECSKSAIFLSIPTPMDRDNFGLARRESHFFYDTETLCFAARFISIANSGRTNLLQNWIDARLAEPVSTLLHLHGIFQSRKADGTFQCVRNLRHKLVVVASELRHTATCRHLDWNSKY